MAKSPQHPNALLRVKTRSNRWLTGAGEFVDFLALKTQN